MSTPKTRKPLSQRGERSVYSKLCSIPLQESFDTVADSLYNQGITEKGGGPVEMNSGSDCSIHPAREVADS